MPACSKRSSVSQSVSQSACVIIISIISRPNDPAYSRSTIQSTYDALLLDVDSRFKVRVLPSEEWRQRHDDRRQPDHQDHRPDRPERPGAEVIKLFSP